MSIVSIISNSAAAIARANLKSHTADAQASIARISSGQRVFSADEDPSALALGSSLAVEVAALRAAQINVDQGVATLQIADGALGEMSDILNRMKALASQAVSGQMSNAERVYLDNEYQALSTELDRISSSTEFNGVQLLGGRNEFQVSGLGTNIDTDNGFVGFEFGNNVSNGDVFQVEYYAPTKVMTVTNITKSTSQSLSVSSPDVGFLQAYNFQSLGVEITFNSSFDDTTSFVHTGADEEFTANQVATPSPLVAEYQVGMGNSADDRVTISLPVVNMNALNLGGTNLANLTNARTVMTAIDPALDVVSSARALIGASMSRLETVGSNLVSTIENSEAARSSLLDANIAEEMTEFTSKQVLSEAAMSMLAQANQRPEMLLQLLQS